MNLILLEYIAIVILIASSSIILKYDFELRTDIPNLKGHGFVAADYSSSQSQ